MTRSALKMSLIVLAAALIGCSNPDSTKFASAAAQGGLTEVQLGRLAVQRRQILRSRVSDSE